MFTLDEWKAVEKNSGVDGLTVQDVLKDWEEDRNKLLQEIDELKEEIKFSDNYTLRRWE